MHNNYGLHCICFYFDLLLHCNQNINSFVYCLLYILPKYILHSINLYDLGNSPVAYNIVYSLFCRKG